jgi:hypothetical protein
LSWQATEKHKSRTTQANADTQYLSTVLFIITSPLGSE